MIGFLKSLDYGLLKEQKQTLIKLTSSLDDMEDVNNIEGLIALIDYIQDKAVYECGFDKNLVFNFTEDN
jgi:hypothetical protein